MAPERLNLAVFLLISATGSTVCLGIRGNGLFSNGRRQQPLFPVPKTEEPRIAQPGVRNELRLNTNREGKSILGIKSLQLESKNTSCEGSDGPGRCVFAWECPASKGKLEIVPECSTYFFHQCCIPHSKNKKAADGELEKQEQMLMRELDDLMNMPTPQDEGTAESQPQETTTKPSGMVKPMPLFGFDKKTKEYRTTTTPPKPELFEKSFLNPSVYECGFRPLVQHIRILGGRRAIFGSWPWIVSIRKKSARDKEGNIHRSGGSLISDQWVLTAAHTVARTARIVVEGSELVVRIGDYDLSTVDQIDRHVDRTVTKIIVHPDFNGITYENDIALLKLDKKVSFADHIQPVCLPAPAHSEEERKTPRRNGDEKALPQYGTVVGWGRTAQAGDLSDILLNVDLPIISNTECENMFQRLDYNESIPEKFLCAGGEGGKDSCQGDSGGPMLVQMDDEDGKSPDRWEIIGLVSWGVGCGVPGLPGVLTSVPHYTRWILSNIQNDTSPESRPKAP